MLFISIFALVLNTRMQVIFEDDCNDPHLKIYLEFQ